MTRQFFNIAGPCQPDIHYMLPPTHRLPDVLRIVDQRGYFVLHAPRQTGKTTTMLALARELTISGRYTALLVSMETGAAFDEDIAGAELAILDTWQKKAEDYLPAELRPPSWPDAPAGHRLGSALRAWAKQTRRPLVLFLDEIDALRAQTLISVLRQLRNGYYDRPHSFPWSLALIGLRDVRDYKVASGGSDHLQTASPFNIKVESFTLSNFTVDDVSALYAQHTAETGQIFTPEAAQLAYDLTQGQPWLVNALAYVITQTLLPDSIEPITFAHVQQAKQILIERKDTHLDSLAERLQEPRVRRIIEPILAGEPPERVPFDDRQYVVDLGLVRRDPSGGFVIANPIYREIIPRVLAGSPQDSLPHIAPTWLKTNGRIDPDRLLQALLSFWKQYGQPLLKSALYHEIAPHLVLMAFLHRVVNGGGSLEREYAIGSRRMDICLRYGPDVMGIELKVWRDGEKDPLPEGLKQLDNYLSGLDLQTGWLVIFDQRSNLPPISERTTSEQAISPTGRQITVIRG